MIPHYHSIARQSPARTAVRDLQEQARSVRLSRTSGVTIRRTSAGTHTRAIASEEPTRATTATSNSYWV